MDTTTTKLLLNYYFTSRQYRGLTISRMPLENSIKISSTASLIFPNWNVSFVYSPEISL